MIIFPDFDPEIFRIGPVAIRWYAIAYIAGIVLGWWYVARLARTERVWGPRFPVATKEQVEDLVLWVTLGVILGGRVGYMLFYNTAALWQSPLEIFKIWEGGMSFHGGLIGVVAAFFWVARLHRIDVLKLSDLAAPVIPIGLFFGRIANFVNAELWGRETYAPWGVVFCNDGIRERLGTCPAGPDPRHPSQLYEAALEGVVLLIVLWMAVYLWGALKRRGLVTGIFLIGYALFRMLVETVREPDANLAGLPLGLTMGMLLSIPMLIGGAYLVVRARGPKGEASAGAVPQGPSRLDEAQAEALQANLVSGGASSPLDGIDEDGAAAPAAALAATPKPKRKPGAAQSGRPKQAPAKKPPSKPKPKK